MITKLNLTTARVCIMVGARPSCSGWRRSDTPMRSRRIESPNALQTTNY
jgi:hypothetical protein